MDIFSKIGSVAEETFQTIKESDVTKKAVNYAGIPGLSMQVGKQESIVKKAYQEIGQMYYEAHKDDVDGEFAEKMAVIKEAMEKIDSLKAEIEEKKKYDPAKDASGNVVDPEETAQAEIVVEATDVSDQVAEVVEEAAEAAEEVVEAVKEAAEDAE